MAGDFPFLMARRKEVTDPAAGGEPFMAARRMRSRKGGDGGRQIGKFLVARDVVVGLWEGGKVQRIFDS
jgi:hypothetical protein